VEVDIVAHAAFSLSFWTGVQKQKKKGKEEKEKREKKSPMTRAQMINPNHPSKRPL
jgi:hypothetical protein